MALNINTTASDLFEKIRSRFESIRIGDEKANNTQDPELARFFNFDFVSNDGTNFGNISVSLIDEQSVKVYFSKNITERLDELQKKEWYDFLRSLRMFAKRHMLSFDTRDIARSNLELKDVKQASSDDRAWTKGEVVEAYDVSKAKGFPFDVDHMPGATVRSQEFNVVVDLYNPKTGKELEKQVTIFAGSKEEACLKAEAKYKASGWEAEAIVIPLGEDRATVKKPRKGTLKWQMQQRDREDYLKGFAKDPHGTKNRGNNEYVAGPSGTSKIVKTNESDNNGVYPKVGDKVQYVDFTGLGQKNSIVVSIQFGHSPDGRASRQWTLKNGDTLDELNFEEGDAKIVKPMSQSKRAAAMGQFSETREVDEGFEATRMSKRDLQDVVAIRNAITRLKDEIKNPNLTSADKADIADRIKKEKQRLGLYGVKEGLEEGAIKDAETALAKHGQYKVDFEKKYGPMSGTDLHQHETMRKQLLAKKKRAQAAYHKKMDEAIGRIPPSHTIEAYGIKGMNRLPWRKSFKNYAELEKWCEKFDAEVYGTRDLEQAKRGNLSPAIPESNDNNPILPLDVPEFTPYGEKPVEEAKTPNARYEMYFGGNKIERFFAPSQSEAIKRAKAKGAISVVKVSQYGKPMGHPVHLKEGWKETLGGIAAAGAIGAAVVNTPPAYVNGERYEYAIAAAPERAQVVKTDDGKTVKVWTTPRMKRSAGNTQPDKLYRPVEEGITESKIYGINRQQSAQDVARKNARIVIKHSKPVMDEVRGARSRAIESIFIENTAGERFKVPSNSLAEARALARHVAEGGNVYDDFGKHISEMCEECSTLREFMRGTRGKEFVDETADEIVNSAAKHYLHLHNLVHSLKGQRGYRDYKQMWESRGPEPDSFDEFDPEELRHRFRQERVDPRIDRTVETAYKAYQRQIGNSDPAELTEFEQHMNQIEEGTWSLPEGDHDYDELVKLFKDPLPVGVDAMNATGALYHLIGDDQLFDMLGHMAEDDPEQDCRQAIVYWLRDHMPKVHKALVQKLNRPEEPKDAEDPTDDQPATKGTPHKPAPYDKDADANQIPAPTNDEPMTDLDDQLNDLQKLSGVQRYSNQPQESIEEASDEAIQKVKELARTR